MSTGGDAGLVELLRQRWGLDQSALTRLANYLWALAHFDLGWSVTFSRPILDVIRERLPNTLLLMGSATALSFGLGSALGIVAGAGPAAPATACFRSARWRSTPSPASGWGWC